MSSNTNALDDSIEIKDVDYAKFIPIISGGLIILGVARLIFYYSLFGVKILSFLDFGEIITSFLDIVLTFIFSSLIAWFLLMVFPLTKRKTEQIQVEILKEGNKELQHEYIKQIRAKIKKLKMQIFGFTLLSILLGTIIILLSSGDWTMICLSAVMIVSTYTSIKYYHKTESKFKKEIALVITAFSVSALMTIFITSKEYDIVRNDKQSLGTRIVFNNEIYLKDSTHTFVSDSLNFYIGKTNSYIFIHHMKDETTSVYPMSTVVQMDLKKVTNKIRLGKLFQ